MHILQSDICGQANPSEFRERAMSVIPSGFEDYCELSSENFSFVQRKLARNESYNHKTLRLAHSDNRLAPDEVSQRFGMLAFVNGE